MKKAKPGIAGIHDPGQLFRSTALARHRRLILPKYLNDEAEKPFLQDSALTEAHKVLIKWADLESNGHLAKKEISLDSQFLDEVFGDALHYLPSAKKPDGYQLEHKFSVPGVGIADGALGSFPPDAPTNARRGHRTQKRHDRSRLRQIQRPHARSAVLGLPQQSSRLPMGDRQQFCLLPALSP